MKNIGKYNGIPCYECSHSEYVNAYDNKLDNGKQIFIIDGTMVQKNTIIGYYNGQHVNDVYDSKKYYVKMPDKKKTATVTAENSKWDEKFVEEVKTSSSTGATYEEVVAKEIRFSDYSKIVDEFFALLEV